MRIAILLLAMSWAARAEIVDRVAASLGLQVLTDAQVVEEIRVQSFIDATPIDLSTENKRKTLDRLIEQTLVRRELEFTRFAPISDAEVEPVLDGMSGRFEELPKYQITVKELRRHIAWTLTMLRFIEYRFQPAVQLTEAQLQQEYRRQQRDNAALPPFEQVRPAIERVVRQRLVDASLDRWLGEARTQIDILFHGEYKL